jgi:hypothetical protein
MAEDHVQSRDLVKAVFNLQVLLPQRYLGNNTANVGPISFWVVSENYINSATDMKWNCELWDITDTVRSECKQSSLDPGRSSSSNEENKYVLKKVRFLDTGSVLNLLSGRMGSEHNVPLYKGGQNIGGEWPLPCCPPLHFLLHSCSPCLEFVFSG